MESIGPGLGSCKVSRRFDEDGAPGLCLGVSRGVDGRFAFTQLTALAMAPEFLANMHVLLFSGPHHAWRLKLLEYLYDRSEFHRDKTSKKVLTLCRIPGPPGASDFDCNLGQLLEEFSSSTKCRDPRDSVIAMKGLHTCRTGGLRPLEVSYEQDTAEVVRITAAHLDGANVSWKGGRIEGLFDDMLCQSGR